METQQLIKQTNLYFSYYKHLRNAATKIMIKNSCVEVKDIIRSLQKNMPYLFSTKKQILSSLNSFNNI